MAKWDQYPKSNEDKVGRGERSPRLTYSHCSLLDGLLGGAPLEVLPGGPHALQRGAAIAGACERRGHGAVVAAVGTQTLRRGCILLIS